MNIIVRPFDKRLCYCRPDTTWERENKDFYVPESINEIYWTPIVFVRICKAGKCIGSKFASRYYDAFNFGTLLYCNDDETAFTSCIDHTSILPAPLYNPVVMENEDNAYEVRRNDEELFRISDLDFKKTVEETICLASQTTSLRIGDFVAVELSPSHLLTSREDNDISLKGTYCDNDLYDFKVIF